MQIVIYSKSNCPNCVSAKALLKSKDLAYSDVTLDDKDNRMAFFLAYPDIRQMPQIFIDGQRVGGLAGLQAALKELGL